MTEGESKLVQLYDEQLQARIGELEAKLGEWEILALGREQRITKAKKILAENLDGWIGSIYMRDAINRAIKALEGK